MARPCKSAKVLTEKSQTKAEIASRTETEDKLRGKSKKPPTAPSWLTGPQKKIFRTIVSELSEAEILCKLDVWILTRCAVAIDHLETIEKRINNDSELIFSKETLAAIEKYTKIFFRCCNELSLSPQSRAKIANINLQKDDSAKLIASIINGEFESEDDEE